MSNDALRGRFERFDRDSNGKIDESELHQLLDELGVGFTASQVRATLESLDADKNGLIDFDEFSSWWTAR